MGPVGQCLKNCRIPVIMESVKKMWCSVIDDCNRKRSVEIQGDTYEVWTHDEKEVEEPLKTYASKLHKIIIQDEGYKYIPHKTYKLLAECTNLKYARHECREPEPMTHFLEFLPPDNLEYLSIDFRERYDNTTGPQVDELLKKILENSPKLKSLELNNAPISDLTSIGGKGNLNSLFIDTLRLPRLKFDMKDVQNLETLVISCDTMESTSYIADLMKNCRKLHSIYFDGSDILPETILNDIMSMPNLRRLHLSTTKNSYESSWYKFSNLVEIRVSQQEPFSSTKEQIISFLQRSKHLRTFYFLHQSCLGFNKLFQEVASEMCHGCKKHYPTDWTNWYNAIPF